MDISDTNEDLERRVARLEAREEIRELVYRYSTAVDDRDTERLGQTFCVDGTFGHADGRDTHHGREAIQSFYRARLALMGPTFHYAHNHVISFQDESRAEGTVLAHAELALEGTTYQVGLRYSDVYRREEGAWRFAVRTIRILYFMPLSELAAGGLAEENRKRYPDAGPTPSDLPESLPTWQAFYGTAGQRPPTS